MAGALERPASRAGVTFELERCDVEDGHVVVTGRWYGVRGMRFMRPTLVVGDRQALATLEHKPWAPGHDELWTAAFLWPDAALEVEEAALSVAPSVMVPLVGDAPAPLAREPAPPEPAPTGAAPPTPAPTASLAADAPGPDPAAPAPPPEPRVEADERAVLRRELAEARQIARDRDARCRELEEILDRERGVVTAATAVRDELEQARAAAERDGERAAAQRDEAVKDREAAVRTRRRMEEQRDEAVGDRDAAIGERDAALAQRDEARAQRDEVLLAHRALERELKALSAREVAATGGEEAAPNGPGGEEPAPDGPAGGEEAAPDPDAPIGVRQVPAARTVAAHLHRAEPEGHPDLSRYDLWAIRFFGTVAAACFILLLVLLLRLFL
jgi:hypothetical protein